MWSISKGLRAACLYFYNAQLILLCIESVLVYGYQSSLRFLPLLLSPENHPHMERWRRVIFFFYDLLFNIWLCNPFGIYFYLGFDIRVQLYYFPYVIGCWSCSSHYPHPFLCKSSGSATKKAEYKSSPILDFWLWP